MKKGKFYSTLLGALLLILTSCGGGTTITPTSNDPSNPPSTPTSEGTDVVVTYTISYVLNGGSGSFSNETVNEGHVITTLNSPTRDGYTFDGWYLDSSLTNRITLPYTVTSNITLYAKWEENLVAFTERRDKTINSVGWSYDSETTLRITNPTTAVTLNGNQDATQTYSSTGDVTYNEEHTNSGSLFVDGKYYEFVKGETLTSVRENENGAVVSYNSEAKPADYVYGKNAFSKALFEYDDDDFKSVTQVSANRYELKTKASFSSIASSVLSYADHPLVSKILGVTIPDSDSSYHLYVEYDSNGYIDKFEYDFTYVIAVPVIGDTTVVCNYELDFTKVNQTTNITEPSFENLSISDTQITADLNTLNNSVNSFKNSSQSAYSYKLVAEQDIEGYKNASTTIQGNTVRKVENSTVYFNNRFEMDTNLENSDYYGSEYGDYNGFIGKIRNGDVYHIYDPMVGLNRETLMNIDTSNYEYMYLPTDLLKLANFDLVERSTDSETSETVYSLSLNNSGVVELITLVNETSKYMMNKDFDTTNLISVLGQITTSSIELKQVVFEIRLSGSSFASIDIEIVGNCNVNYLNTATTISGESEFSIDLEIAKVNLTATYQIPTDEGDIQSNYNDVF